MYENAINCGCNNKKVSKVKSNIISVTDAAASYINSLLKKNKANPIGIGIIIESGGCSGSKYSFKYVYKNLKKEHYFIYVTSRCHYCGKMASFWDLFISFLLIRLCTMSLLWQNRVRSL